MKRTVVVDEDAADEADAQARYYAEQAGLQVALGFAAEIEAIYRALTEDRVVGANHPRVPSSLSVKRVFLDRFPFAVVFHVEGDAVRVIAIEALRKRPGYWRSRLR